MMIAVGIAIINDFDTSGGTWSGILIWSLSIFVNLLKPYPTSNPIIIATKIPFAPR